MRGRSRNGAEVKIFQVDVVMSDNKVLHLLSMMVYCIIVVLPFCFSDFLLLFPWSS